MKRLGIPATLLAVAALSLATLQPAMAEEEDTGLGTFDEALSGQEAVDALGEDLQKVADSLDITPSELADALAEEHTSVLPTGRIAMAHPAAPAGTVRQPIALAADWDDPLADVFKLESKPGSSKTIYLDFDGDTMSSTAWWVKAYGFPRTVKGYSIDSNFSNFNNEERRSIAWIWAQVAEDYAPFDVNVTTKRPANLSDVLGRSSTSDTKYGAHVVISSQANLSKKACSGGACSGIAFIGTFTHFKGKKYGGVADKSLGRDYQPAWVFDEATTTGQSANYIADTASHEAGHNLGLLHSSGTTDYYTGHNNWAPIMGGTRGSGGVYRPISQWSNGHYPGAKHISGYSSSAHKDQLAVIRSHGLKHRADEVGATVNVSKKIRTGYIAQTGDQDTVVIGYCPANTTITVGTATMANLDTRLELLNSAGTVISSSSGSNTGSIATGMTTSTSFPSFVRKPSNMGAIIKIPSDGVHYLRISGEGSTANNYPAYGSLGKWSVNSPCDSTSAGAVPGAPTELSAKPGNKSATLSWNYPTEGRVQDITAWQITHTGGTKVVTVAANTRSTTIKGLKNGKRTQFTVTPLIGAQRTYGTAAKVSATPRTVPSAPKISKASSGKKGGKVTAKVSWKAPSKTNGAKVTHYIVYAHRYKGKKVVQTKASTKISASKRSYEMKLPKKAKYHFTVKAVNAAGKSKASKKSKKVDGR